ncbi:GNAT family N-acetyltransferase [Paenibacillus sp. KQZ6P-2]|uniref:GNAT family N-acetyltransferase n=1 Tax=Paenibacillus mangrovi TaxID=2931978 RepID=A0A9X1WTD5_9BACL|nr:GNAT family N-acetyltransferase [Paenibacillus mangrovi]MCJ8013243.1 GNAT family N-acetyltransferase [Paenibacillus mangrovi]
MKIQVETLYVLDDRERIAAINEPLDMQPPAVFIGKTKEGLVIRFRRDLPQKLIEEILSCTEASLDVVQLCRVIESYKKVTDIWMGPAYVFRWDDVPPVAEPNILLIGESNRHLLKKNFSILHEELSEHLPAAGYVADGEVVSICCSARISGRAAEASLKTVEAFRGQGLAPLVVQSWCRQVSRQGLIPLYSTSWDNLSSQAVARKLGLHQYGMDLSISTG